MFHPYRTMHFDPHAMQSYIQSYGALAPFVFIVIYVVAVQFFMPSIPFMLSAGLMFGARWGFVYVLIGSMLGATISFAIARKLGEPFVDRFLRGSHKKLATFEERLMRRYGWLTVIVLRVAPIFPFPVANYGLGLTRVRLRDYLIGTFLGIIPATFVFVSFGNAVVTMQMRRILFAFGLVALVCVGGFLYKKFHSPIVSV